MKRTFPMLGAVLAMSLLGACSSNYLPPAEMQDPSVDAQGQYQYRIGTGDILTIFVWRSPDISGDYGVRPDGRINMALTDTLVVAGKTTEQVAENLTKHLKEYIKNPKVTVMLKQTQGHVTERVRIVGEATTPLSMAYRDGMTLMDLMIAAGGLSPYADGNDAELVRIENGKPVYYRLRLLDLINDADLSANVKIMPGDVIRIPEAWF